MFILKCLLWTSIVQSQDLKLSGWVSCSEWSCEKPIQEGIARLNFIGVKTSDDLDWLTIKSGETIVVTGKDAGTYKGQQILCGYIKNKPDRGFGLFPNSVIRVLRDKMNTLGERRFWTDLQEEKRNPGKEIEEKVSEEKSSEEASNDTEDIIENNAEAQETEPPLEQPLDTEPVDPTVDPIESAGKAEENARLAEEAEAERLRKLEEEAMRNLRPLQKTSQIWRWIDDMLDDQFVERLVLTLRDEQSALLLLVSARMATQKTQGIEELKVFNEKAKEVSQYVEDAHGIGKRRDAKTPPTMSQLSVVAYSVIQLLLEPHSATLYYENKKVHPPYLQQVQIKYGLIEDPNSPVPDDEEKKEELPQPTEQTLDEPSNSDEEFIADNPEDFFPNYDDTALEDIDPDDIELPPSDIEYDDYPDYDEQVPLSDENLNDELDLLNDLDRILEEDLIGEVLEDPEEVIENPSSDSEPEINSEQQGEVEPEIEDEDEIERQMREAREKIEALQREKERRSTTPEPATEEIIPEAESEGDIKPYDVAYEEIVEDPNEVDQREIHDEIHEVIPVEIPEEKFDDFENLQANAEDWGIEDPEVLKEEIPPKIDKENQDVEEVPQNELHQQTFEEPPPSLERHDEEAGDILEGIQAPTDFPYEDNPSDDIIIKEEEPANQDQPEDFQEIKNETNDEEEELRRRYQAKAEEEYHQRIYEEIYYRQNMLVKIMMNFGSLLDTIFGRSWPGLFIFVGFFTYLIQNSIAIFGDGGVMEKCHAIEAELAKSEKKKLEVQNDKHQSSNLLYQKRNEIEHTNNEINSITKAISELKNWETEMENYFANVLRTQLSETQHTNNQMEIDSQNIDREIIETREKQQSLHSEKGRDMQALSEMESRKAEHNVELGRFKEELESLKSEHEKMEAEIKKQKLVFSNYQEKLQKCSSQTKEVNKKFEKSRKQRENSEKKEIDVRNALLELKTVYQWLEANANITGESAEEIMLNQQEFLLESIRKVPELVESKKQMTNQIEKEESEISDKNKIFSSQEEKIKSTENESQDDTEYIQLREDVDKLEAEFEVTQEYYSKREMEISMQLGSETASRGQSEELYEKQRAKENRLKDQLEKLKKQVSDLENKWEMADIQHQQTVGISEERKSKNQQSLMEAESRYGQRVQQVRQLRGETSDIDDLVEQAEEYLAELNEKYDFEMSKRSENGSRPSSRSGSVKSGSITGRSYVSSRSGLHSEHGSPEKRSFNKSYPR